MLPSYQRFISQAIVVQDFSRGGGDTMLFQCAAVPSVEGSSCIHVIGEIDINSVRNFRDQIMRFTASCTQNLRIDCSQLTYIDSQGLNVLACIYNKLKPQQRKITLLNTSSNIKKLLSITGLDRVLSLEN